MVLFSIPPRRYTEVNAATHWRQDKAIGLLHVTIAYWRGPSHGPQLCFSLKTCYIVWQIMLVYVHEFPYGFFSAQPQLPSPRCRPPPPVDEKDKLLNRVAIPLSYKNFTNGRIFTLCRPKVLARNLLNGSTKDKLAKFGLTNSYPHFKKLFSILKGSMTLPKLKLWLSISEARETGHSFLGQCLGDLLIPNRRRD